MGTGFFGKLPLSGDFVARGLPAGTQATLDRWLTRLLVACGRAPEGWPTDGVRGLIAHAGKPFAVVIVPSRDAAGREFPLAALTPAPGTGKAQVNDWAMSVLPALQSAARGEQDAAGLLALLDGAPDLPAASDIPRRLVPPLFWAVAALPDDPDGFAARMADPGCF